MLVDDLLRDGQPESGSLRLGRPKRSQELRAVEPRRYARAPVPHQDARLLAVGARGDFHRAVARARSFQRILDEVAEGAAELIRVAIEPERIGGALDGHRRASRIEAARLAEEVGQIDGHLAWSGQLGELGKALRHAEQDVDLLPEQLRGFRRGLRVEPRDAGDGEPHCGEGVFQLVREAAGDGLPGSELLGELEAGALRLELGGHAVEFADQEAKLVDPEASALLLDLDGNVTETNAANFLIVDRGAIISPTLANTLPGISRALIIELADNGVCIYHGEECHQFYSRRDG